MELTKCSDTLALNSTTLISWMIVLILCSSTSRLTVLAIILDFVAPYLEREWLLEKSPLPSLLIRVQDVKAQRDVCCAFNPLRIPGRCLCLYLTL